MAEAAGIATTWRDVHGAGEIRRPRHAARGARRPGPAGGCGRGARDVLRALSDRAAAADHHDGRPGWRADPGRRDRPSLPPGYRRRRPDRGPSGTGLGRRGAAARHLHPRLPPAAPGRRALHRRRGAGALRDAGRSRRRGAWRRRCPGRWRRRSIRCARRATWGSAISAASPRWRRPPADAAAPPSRSARRMRCSRPMSASTGPTRPPPASSSTSCMPIPPPRWAASPTIPARRMR